MRVTYLSPSGQLGGAEASLLDILASVTEAEPSWRLQLVIAADGPLAARAAALGVATEVVPFPHAVGRLGESGAASIPNGLVRFAAELGIAAVPLAAYARQLRRAIARFGPSLIHTNGLKMHLLGSYAGAPTPVVWHVHDYLGPRPVTSRLLRLTVSRCSTIVANSRSVADDVRAAIGQGVRIVAVHNAVDLRRFSPDGDRIDLDRLAGLAPPPRGALRVGLLGTFARWKGHATFLQAIASLPPHLPVRAYIIGDAVYQTDGSQYSRDDLRQLAASWQVTDRVGFTGFVAGSEAALRALDIVVHASTAPEPFGLVIAEAMACGRPLVVSHAGGAAELVTPDVDALVHAPGNTEQLARAITALITDPPLRARLGRAARATAERAFDRARLARELVPIYRAVAA
jgi:glycosyltransferase involved in cell wall biosynthesis